MSEQALAVRRWLGAPDGRVTLLFTDIVGSTDRLAALGESRWLEALRGHNAVVTELIRAHGGTAVKFTGDGWMVAFAEPADAVACAVEIQGALAAQDGDGFAVRIGVHRGRAIQEGPDFLGTAVVVASRITRQARPGEILVTWPVRVACEPGTVGFGPPRDVRIRGLGSHRAFPASDPRDPRMRA